MKKAEILKKLGVKIRRVNFHDLMRAKTDYQRQANFIIKTSFGDEFYSQKGALKDVLWAESISKQRRLYEKKKK